MLTLSDADRQAVELFFESYWGEVGEPAPVARRAEIAPRIAAVSMLFEGLGALAAAEPSADLAKRVMKAVERMPARWQLAEAPAEAPAARQ